MKKTLLLSSSYEAISFVSERKMLKLFFKEKVEVISSWNDIIFWSSGKIQYPSIIKLKNSIKINYTNFSFSRKTLIKRDKSHCQYCNKKLSPSQITIDHVMPKVLGGVTSFNNCVVCCYYCNNKKADKTLEKSGMVLLKQPVKPPYTIVYKNIMELDPSEPWHNDWNDYLK